MTDADLAAEVFADFLASGFFFSLDFSEDAGPLATDLDLARVCFYLPSFYIYFFGVGMDLTILPSSFFISFLGYDSSFLVF